MMVLSHVFVGAAVGEELSQPLLAFILMVFFHLVLDKVPHFWPKSKGWGKFFMIFDISAGNLLLLSILIFQPPHFVSVFAGAFGGILVDVIFVGIPKVRKSRYGAWQHERQIHKSNPWFLLTDITAIIIGLIVWLR